MTEYERRAANDDLAATLGRFEDHANAAMKAARLAKPDPDIVLVEWLAATMAAATVALPLIRHEYGLQTWIHVAGAVILVAFAAIYQVTPKLWRLDRKAASRARAEFASSVGGTCRNPPQHPEK